MNIINYLGCETHLPRQKRSLRLTEGKEVDQADLNLVHFKTKGKIFNVFQSISTISHIPTSCLQPQEHRSDFSSIYTIFAALVKQVNSTRLLDCLLVTLMTYYQVRCVSEVSLRLPPTIFLWFCPQCPFESSWNASRTAFIFFCVQSQPYIKSSNTELLFWLWNNSISDILNKDSRLSKIFFM